MTDEDKNINFLNRDDSLKKNAYATPDGYFESLEDALMSQILEEKISIKTSKETGMTVPDTYFEAFDEKILHRLNSKNKKSKLYFLQHSNLYKFASIGIAAAFLIWFSVTSKNNLPTSQDLNFDSISTSDLNNWVSLETDELNTYELASLYEEDGDLFFEEDIIYSNSISDTDLELYLNTIEIDDLLDSEN